MPVFGFGWALVCWALISIVLLTWLFLRRGWTEETRGYLPVLLLTGAAIVWLLPMIEEVAPNGAKKGLQVRGYGVMLLIGMSSAVALAAHRARKAGIHPDHIFSLAFWMVVAGIAGARLYYVVEFWDEFVGDGQSTWAVLQAISQVHKGGLVVYGSLIGGFAAAVVYIRRAKLPLLAMGDLIAPSLVLGLAFGRIGCLLNGCCFGHACQLPWSISFPKDSPPYIEQHVTGQLHGIRVRGGADGAPMIQFVEPGSLAAQAGLNSGDQIKAIDGVQVASVGMIRQRLGHRPATFELTTHHGHIAVLSLPNLPRWSYPVHPTQIYSTINALLICLLLLAYYPLRRRDGEVFALCLTIYPFARFLLEIIRSDGSIAWIFKGSQCVSVIILIATGFLWIYLWMRPQGSDLPGGSPYLNKGASHV